jgi:hypothetical protein
MNNKDEEKVNINYPIQITHEQIMIAKQDKIIELLKQIENRLNHIDTEYTGHS